MIHRNLLGKIKKANKVRRMKLAKENGFDTVETFIQYLEDNLEPLPVPEKSERLTIHIVYVLDSSGSMFNYGSHYKFHMAIQGINSELIELKQATDVDYVISLHEFSNVMYTHLDAVNVKDVGTIEWKEFRNTTALNDTVYNVLAGLKKNNDPSIKVLVKVFTDGMDIGSSKRVTTVARAIATVPENFTFTFVAAREDESRLKAYKIEKSNVLLHDNTTKGVEAAFKRTRGATIMYSAAAMAGEDVTAGFYKRKIN